MLLLATVRKSVIGSAARAAAFAALSSAVAAGFRHFATGNPVVSPLMGLSAVSMFLCALPAFHLAPRRIAVAVVATAQACLPVLLAVADHGTGPGGHHLPAAVHDPGLVTVTADLVAALALACLFNGACEALPRLLRAFRTRARPWISRAVDMLGSRSTQPREPVVRRSWRTARTTVPSSQTACLRLRHQRVPCGP